ncbi:MULTISPECIES: hypothetical protein [Fusobacterium]|jgi:hypothetical protein
MKTFLIICIVIIIMIKNADQLSELLLTITVFTVLFYLFNWLF